MSSILDDDELFINLDILSQLLPGDKLVLHEKHICIHRGNTYLKYIKSSFQRTKDGKETKENAAKFITSCVLKLESRVSETHDKIILKTILDKLPGIIQGLKNHATTYKSYIFVHSTIKHQILKLEVLEKKITESIQE